jgi:hypothetical protein
MYDFWCAGGRPPTIAYCGEEYWNYKLLLFRELPTKPSLLPPLLLAQVDPPRPAGESWKIIARPSSAAAAAHASEVAHVKTTV